ncbi:MAG: GyrI-like domain-containing protein [Burkholderiales bacterium]
MEPTREHIDAFAVAGLTVRTTNREEIDPNTQRIGALWGRFFSESLPDKTPGRTSDARIHGVYSNYELDAHGPFDLTCGVAVEPRADAVPIEAGDYLVFRGAGPMPQTVIAAWQRIWQYFGEHPQVVRRFVSDFETYEGSDAVAIHIGVK